MIVRLQTGEGVAASKVMELRISTQDAADLPLLLELFHGLPPGLRVRVSLERHGDYADATLYLSWPKEGK